LTRAGFWLDDGQIFDGRTTKYYAEKNGDARILVTVEAIAQ
jgi:Holliday junction resolvase RusA-like endonuclease